MKQAAVTPPSLPQWRLYSVLGAAVTVCALEISMLFPTLPALIRHFADPTTVMWTVTIHYLAAASSVALAGRLGDLFGRKRVLLAALGIALCGSLISLNSESLLGIIIGRGLQGLSAAAIPLSFGLVRELVSRERVPFGIGVVATAAPVVGGVGALLGGLLVDNLSWRWIFGTSAALAACTILLAWRALPRGTRHANNKDMSIDVVGGVLLPPAVAAMLLAIHHSRHWGWLDARTVGLLAAGATVLAYWFRHEWKHANPLIDVRLLQQRQIRLANLGMALFGLGALQGMQILSLLLQQPSWTGVGLGISATMTGMFFVPFIVINLVGGPLSGRIASRHGGRRPALIGMCLTGIGWTALAFEHSQLWYVMAMAYVQTLGIAMLFAALPNLVVEDAPSDRTSEATGVLSVVRQFAASIGTQVIVYMLATSTVSDRSGDGAQFPSDAAFTLTFGFVATVCWLSVLVTSLLPRRGPASTRSTATSTSR